VFRSKEMEAQRPSFSPPFSSLPSNSILLRNLAFQHDACYSSFPSRDSSGPRYVALLLFPTPLPSLSSRVHRSSSPSLLPPAFSSFLSLPPSIFLSFPAFLFLSLSPSLFLSLPDSLFLSRQPSRSKLPTTGSHLETTPLGGRPRKEMLPSSTSSLSQRMLRSSTEPTELLRRLRVRWDQRRLCFLL